MKKEKTTDGSRQLLYQNLSYLMNSILVFISFLIIIDISVKFRSFLKENEKGHKVIPFFTEKQPFLPSNLKSKKDFLLVKIKYQNIEVKTNYRYEVLLLDKITLDREKIENCLGKWVRVFLDENFKVISAYSIDSDDVSYQETIKNKNGIYYYNRISNEGINEIKKKGKLTDFPIGRFIDNKLKRYIEEYNKNWGMYEVLQDNK